MSLKPVLAVGMLAVLTAGAVFQLKYVVRERERELTALRRASEAERWRIRTLKADWAWLTRPDRLALQSTQLALKPMQTGDLVRVEDLEDAAHLQYVGRALTVELESGLAVELRFKPAAIHPAAKRSASR